MASKAPPPYSKDATSYSPDPCCKGYRNQREIVKWAHKRITVRLYDSKTYTVYRVMLDSGGVLDMPQFAKQWGVRELVVINIASRSLSFWHPNGVLWPSDLKSEMNPPGVLAVTENVEFISPSINTVPRVIRVRWYTSSGREPLDVFEETLEHFDEIGQLCLGQIAQRRGVANVQVFDTHDEVRYVTKAMRVLFKYEIDRVMALEGYLALTEAASDLPTKKPRWWIPIVFAFRSLGRGWMSRAT